MQADPVSYDISFSFDPGYGTAPTAASFNFDSSTGTFSDLIIVDEGLQFDLTSSANSPVFASGLGVCVTADTAAGFFNALTAAGCTPIWFYEPAPHYNDFSISVCNDGGTSCAPASTIFAVDDVTGVGTESSGELTVTAVPEPSALWLCAMGALALIARSRLRLRSRSARTVGLHF